MSGTHPGCDKDGALFSTIFRQFVGMVCRQCLGLIPTTLGTQANFQQNEGARDAARFLGIFQQFLGTVCRPCPGRSLIFKYFKVVSGSRCAGHVQDAFEPWRGWSLIFRHFRAVFGHSVQAMSGTRPDHGHVQVAAGTQPDFQTFLGSFWDTLDASWLQQGHSLTFRYFMAIFGQSVHAVSGMRPGCGIYGQLLGIVCSPCPGRVLSRQGQPDFHSYIGNFWVTVCKPCPGCHRDISLFSCISTQFSRARCAGIVLDASGPRQFLEHGVQAMFGMRLGHDRDAAWFPSISRQFLGHDVQAMSRLLQGYILIFTYFYTISWTRCVGHVQDAFEPWQGQSLIFRSPCAGHVKDALGPQQGRSLIFRKLWLVSGDGEQAMSRTPPGQVGMQPDIQAFLGISRQFLGLGAQAKFGTRHGHDRDAV
ncbi:Hypothetical predicted protein [Olea europaea subsp. europaea]|uniref:Uncharacterized protein n=1 Tax=Olea europaea subsp. europaea TaxID=158383 RepID=A0A8S0TTL0_OLEEU|nr:Hypothetical predicted protein [Olea europaea subsp. europaea]